MKYVKRNNHGIYVTDFYYPSGSKQRRRLSLGHGNADLARRFEENYIVPLLNEDRVEQALKALKHAIERTTATRKGREADLYNALGQGDDLGRLTRDFLKHLKRGDLAPATLRKYRVTMEMVTDILGESRSVARIETADVVAFRDFRLLRANPNTVRDDLMRLRSFLRWVIDEGRTALETIPGREVSVPRAQKKQKLCPSMTEIDALMALPRPPARDELSWIGIPVIGRYTGMRIGEIAQLESAQVVLEQRIPCLHVRGDLKTASSDRLIPIADKLAPVIDRLFSAGGRFFPECGDWRSTDGIVKRGHQFLKSWNIAAKRIGGFSFHCLRVYANNQMTSAGVDIIDRQRLLGHRSEQTQSAYTPADLERFRAAVNTIY